MTHNQNSFKKLKWKIRIQKKEQNTEEKYLYLMK